MTVIRPRPLVDIPRRSRRPYVEPEPGTNSSPRAPQLHSSEHAWARSYRARLRVTDTIIIFASIAAAFVARFGIDGVATQVAGFPVAYFTISVIIGSSWVVALYAYHTRDPRVVGMGLSEYKRVANASALTFGILAIAFLVAKVDIARGYFVLALPLGATALLGSRWIWRQWLLKQRAYDHYLSRALVVGGRDDVEYVVKQIQQKSGAAYNVVGAALEDPGAGKLVVGDRDVPIVANLDTITQAASNLHVDSVIVAGQPQGGGTFIRNLGWALEGTATDLVLASRLTDVAGPRIHFRPVEGLPLIHVEIPQFEGGKHVLKRALDLVVSGMALLVLLPFMVAVGIAIRLDTKGDALFRQERVGRNGSTFRMLKFRSMVQDAESGLAALQARNQGAGVLFKMKDDPRVTRVGRFIRKFSIDELPQLWNVFVGDMSLVGPRPPLRREVDGYETHVHRRLYIKPGLTGMWQVNGRSDLSWDESVRLDLYYVENWSLTGDIVILWRTFHVLVHPTGAY
ncbi:sugar transferase [Diaminobutyricibacter tongyongensis]|uniref:Sugar transferase n=1 Tax=Leifsonia tongyongensis TaxID=1268043 RepID=A0A6L9XU02_9MICO|nr:sugar transferase [Diaminobutyricibacter tongyongensis]NEN04786.1 sugar transferase [Diaminobutyricibacter tongyongensis]